jgi:hypothetical protein
MLDQVPQAILVPIVIPVAVKRQNQAASLSSINPEGNVPARRL